VSTLKSSAENLTLNADGANNDIILQSNGSTKVTLDGQNSRLGIGTASPSSTLHIEDNSNYTLKVSKSGSNIHLASFASNGSAALGIAIDDSSNLVRLNSEGSNDSLQLEVADGTIGLKIDSTGAVTKPLQPAFLVQASDMLDLAVATTTVVWGTEVFDIGSNFASNTFTAPVTGKYQFNLALNFSDFDTDLGYIWINMQTSNRLIYLQLASGAQQRVDGYACYSGSQLLDMDISDTCYIRLQIAGGAAQNNLIDSSWFSGYLVA